MDPSYAFPVTFENTVLLDSKNILPLIKQVMEHLISTPKCTISNNLHNQLQNIVNPSGIFQSGVDFDQNIKLIEKLKGRLDHNLF